ncbi:AIR synthase-related protein [Alkalihalobacillus oceani]|uniref:AIR synthase-related protein n=1 Tax=Halalkalibacter oceani TaxID=1653776 RepID=A0A9X2DUC5_9BACI|nr:AIR synthase related protein [Halalkalibacter oceani]MCM3716538.1 AIR synthase-related protein [Halalkalibacter oceani]
MEGFHSLMKRLKRSQALERKKAISAPLQAFEHVWNFGHTEAPIGDDAAIMKVGEDYLLFSCDGIIPALVKQEPYWAGFCAVLVSASDIYAMGGKPLALVNMLSAPDEQLSSLIAEGMAEGCRKLAVPMVGGHFFPYETEGVATAIIGRADKVLDATKGQAGHSLIVALDLVGKPYKDYLQWNSTSFLSAEELQRKFNVLPALASSGLAHAARDISNAGVLGTIVMLAENGRCGAEVNLGKIPKPPGIEWERWLQMYPGYGFVLAVDPSKESEVIRAFEWEGIQANVVGKLTNEAYVIVTADEESSVFWDFRENNLVVETK